MEVAAATWEYGAAGERAPSDASGTHQIAMAATVIEGVRLTVLGWTPPEPEPGPPPPPVDTVTTLQLDVSFDALRDGAGVALRLRVANPTAQAVTFDFASGQRYDFAAMSPAGEILWRWSADKAFPMAFGSVTLQPGASLQYDERWDPDGVTGEVVLEAALTSLNLPIVRSVALEL